MRIKNFNFNKYLTEEPPEIEIPDDFELEDYYENLYDDWLQEQQEEKII